jgi:hypothetical protein
VYVKPDASPALQNLYSNFPTIDIFFKAGIPKCYSEKLDIEGTNIRAYLAFL